MVAKIRGQPGDPDAVVPVLLACPQRRSARGMFRRGPYFCAALLVLGRRRNREILEWIDHATVHGQILACEHDAVVFAHAPIAALEPCKGQYARDIARW